MREFLNRNLLFHGEILLILLLLAISIGNSMICSDIWHKYHN